MQHLVRWETVHPALAHFTLGGLPLIVIAYALALWRRSTAWTFAGDMALVVTAALTLGTLAFGVVSDNTVAWPGGLERWRWLHLVAGFTTAGALVALAVMRLWLRRLRAGAPTGTPTLAFALAAAAVAGFTGWIGGEVLVFHGGIAVRAAGDGALAPPLDDGQRRSRNFLEAMRGARAAWAGVETRLAWMLVHRPRPQDFAEVQRDARALERFAGEMAASEDLASMSKVLAADADKLAAAAAKQNLADLSRAAGETGAHCADCHQSFRW